MQPYARAMVPIDYVPGYWVRTVYVYALLYSLQLQYVTRYPPETETILVNGPKSKMKSGDWR